MNKTEITQKLVDYIKLIPDKHVQEQAYEDSKIYWTKLNEDNPCLKFEIPEAYRDYYKCKNELRQETYIFIHDKYSKFVPLNDISQVCSSKD